MLRCWLERDTHSTRESRASWPWLSGRCRNGVSRENSRNRGSLGLLEDGGEGEVKRSSRLGFSISRTQRACTKPVIK